MIAAEVTDVELKQAPNFEAILDWVDEYRRDLGPFIRQTMAGARRQDASCEALVLLLVVGFAAGRRYQQRHPELKEDWEYHR